MRNSYTYPPVLLFGFIFDFSAKSKELCNIVRNANAFGLSLELQFQVHLTDDLHCIGLCNGKFCTNKFNFDCDGS